VDTVIGDGGLVVDPLDDDAIAAALLRLADPETARRLGALAAARAPLFTWRLTAERLIRALAPPGVDVSALASPL
jgi:glycosyltransferase involved in cell wall biosynthesis